jgi:hypothetical protein
MKEWGRTNRLLIGGVAGACCLASGWCAAQEAEKPATGQRREVILLDLGRVSEPTHKVAVVQVGESAAASDVEQGATVDSAGNLIDVEVSEMPRYMLGLGVAEVSPQLHAYLGINSGLFVERVAEDSPAEQIGIQAGDILLSFAEQEIKDVAGLRKAVEVAGTNSSKIVVQRKGERIELEITPVERKPLEVVGVPAGNVGNDHARLLELLKQSGLNDPEQVKQLEEQLKQLGQGKSIDVLRLGPAITITGDEKAGDDEAGHSLSLTVDLEDEDSPKLRLELDGKVWETTPEKLEELGESIGEMVEKAIEPFVESLEGVGEGQIKITARVQQKHAGHAADADEASGGADVKQELRLETQGKDGQVRIFVPGLMGSQPIEVPIPQIALDLAVPDLDVESLIPGKVLMLRSQGDVDLSKQIEALRTEIESLKQQLQAAEEKLNK